MQPRGSAPLSRLCISGDMKVFVALIPCLTIPLGATGLEQEEKGEKLEKCK